MQLKDLHKVHMIGIKGTGMSALALALSELGIRVSGSDSADSFLLLDQKNFDQAGITIATPFDKENLPTQASVPDAVITSTSHGSDNPEIIQAKKLEIPVLTYPEMLAMLTQSLPSYAVCGSHGKTTVTNWLAFVARDCGVPALVVGGPTSQQVLNIPVKNLSPGLSSKAYRSPTGRDSSVVISAEINDRFAEGSGRELFIFEADEYQNKLAMYNPRGVVLTNVELDHPDYFKTEAEYEQVFIDFVKRIPKDGWLVYCTDDARASAVAKHAICKKIPYSVPATKLDIALLGDHNQLNAQAVVWAAKELGLTDDQIATSLPKFHGAHRRMEKISDDPLIYDDYGHHPTEIRSTLRALRNTFRDKEIWTVFHPHTFTRTKKFLTEFGQSFKDSDHTIVLDIFESREANRTADITSLDVVYEIKKNGGDAYYLATFDQVAEFLKDKLNKNTLLLTIGAGDVWKLHSLLK
ncbi:MAG: hypothetical protein A3A33_03540 [Candidatus Yanofskybacteria bacterium RIFCSPLOWO2_01_FULL_49_25]|uniref:UDP-N-acetylmuramate--L-alanine ligase n=1 Tax=Candidatus Yanofskybacteria bacterium RIFCSPLOWO2_01_FULL_49_25 TaxID=1802701 RepID=A0A1F8GTR7_9BACT|nr:MAG: hypothetical protein A3A33_03540 [Candidatus Yanofskybacteria bacterium RIFCSPLOWO2_01_FULL_49_25]